MEANPIIESQNDVNSEPGNMTKYNIEKIGQNTETGRKANEFGRLLGKMIADYFGIKLENNSNKGTLITENL
mgnify:CR=1 FL=1|jgi:hypothetical protein